MLWNVSFVFVMILRLAKSAEGYGPSPRISSAWGYFNPPLLQRLPPTRQTPMEEMVELTNELAVAILQDHSFSRGNFAFSPYGVASVLVVLYEGARGESARQIHRAVGFPSDKDVIRVGFRDIHRHLRSYFSHEGYLSGISLNREGSSLRPEYKKILRFYGYDVEFNHTMEEEEGGSSTSTAVTETTKTTASVSTSTSPITQAGKTEGATVSENITAVPEMTSSTTETENTSVVPEVTNSATESERITAVPDVTSSAMETESITAVPEVTNSATESERITTVPEVTSSATETESITADPVVTNSATETERITADPEVTSSATETENTSAVPEVTNSATEAEDTSAVPEVTTSATESENITAVPEVMSSATTVGTGKNETEELEKTSSVFPTTATEPFESEYDEIQIDLTIDDNSNCSLINEGKQEGCSGVTETAAEKESEDRETLLTSTELPVTEPKTTEKSEGTTDEALDNGMLIPQPGDLETTTDKSTATETTSTIPTETTTIFPAERTTLDSEERKKKLHGVSTPKTENKLKRNTTETDKKLVSNIRSMFNSRSVSWLGGKPKKSKSRKARTITDYLRALHNTDLSLQLQNGMYDTHISRNADLYRSLPRLLFLVDGAIDTPVPMMTYMNVFSFAYIPRLHSKAMEFPLDDDRYKLLILLPVERRGLRQLIYDLMAFPLGNVLKAMRPQRVRAMVPTFMVEGFVILTSSLQKLGIWDVFDPRKANLSGMSMDPELYVRNVEQSVTVVIRNYVEILDIQTRTMAARHIEQEFEATHPFLYFVMDTATNVALMAGQMLDPLNSRIY